nr:glutamate--tRNA ligase [uncultured Sphingomonas sp.]
MSSTTDQPSETALPLDVLTPSATLSMDEIHQRYPARSLPEGARVTRFGPSPTGFIHIGGLYVSLISERTAHQSGGLFYLRIEDTDRKREVPGAVELILGALNDFGITFDEGPSLEGTETGAYGPYRQSERQELYQSVVRDLLVRGHAYACFATPEELEAMRTEQNLRKIPPGYYGSWAIWRNRSLEDVQAALAEGRSFVIRLKAPAAEGNGRVELPDLIRGKLNVPANNQDIVLLKADGLPTYHLAHVVDDHLMGTTDVIRGDEWLSSYPVHAQLFDLLGWQRPRYAHIAPIEKNVGSSRRKLSKRHDPEAAVDWYSVEGYPRQAVIEYLLNLADGKFEDWRKANPTADSESFPLQVERLNRSGALFDLVKLSSISREVIGAMTAAQVYDAALAWAQVHDQPFAERLAAHADYVRAILNIERGAARARKDIVKWSDVPSDTGYFFDDLFVPRDEGNQALWDALAPGLAAILREVAEGFDPTIDRDAWLEWVRAIGEKHGYAANGKAYKAEPERYQGQFSAIAGALRLALAGKPNTPDLFEVMTVMGPERVRARLSAAAAWIEGRG